MSHTSGCEVITLHIFKPPQHLRQESQPVLTAFDFRKGTPDTYLFGNWVDPVCQSIRKKKKIHPSAKSNLGPSDGQVSDMTGLRYIIALYANSERANQSNIGIPTQ